MALLNNVFDQNLFEEWLREKKNMTESSIYVYRTAIDHFLSYNPNINNIDDYNKFIIKHCIKKRSVHYYSILKIYIKFVITDINKRNLMIENLIKPEVPSTRKRERKYLEEKVILGVINNLKTKKHKILALIQNLTGIRSGDILRIKKKDIIPELYDDKNVVKLVVTGKGNKRNIVYIHEEMVQILLIDYLIGNVNETSYAFLEDETRRDKTMQERKMLHANYKAYYRDLKMSLNTTGISHDDFATHDYRRCFARRVWTKYKDVQVLQNLLNHKNPATTMLYLSQSGLKNIEYFKQMQS